MLCPSPSPRNLATSTYYFELTWTTAADLAPQILCIGAYPTVVPSKSTPLSKQIQTLGFLGILVDGLVNVNFIHLLYLTRRGYEKCN
jgi:hypothetical protein